MSSENEEEEEIFEVEAILGHRKQKDKIFYKIKWKGYSLKDCTWEEEKNLSCPDILNEYIMKLEQEAKDKTQKSPTQSKLTKFLKNQDAKPPKKVQEDKEKSQSSNVKKSAKQATSPKKVKSPSRKMQLSTFSGASNNQRKMESSLQKLENNEGKQSDVRILDEILDPLIYNKKKVQVLAVDKDPDTNRCLYLVQVQHKGKVMKKVLTSSECQKYCFDSLIKFYIENIHFDEVYHPQNEKHS
ncbi:hypothetical protein TRFO_01290 [Tritrichomonas foetus]|uniref:Chromo domain-containing protein n=1 Tax=Tritrichomonas foetus TaxID=1144522 RepID=A0A1J4K7I9_9EUKA|nr:hypothetical protein TRFO_01290 [Tritrichomonas foetus]|eukprot:OHT07163.1 hypothetical protein TRFO_01290 [Tritrichomonas foetus]